MDPKEELRRRTMLREVLLPGYEHPDGFMTGPMRDLVQEWTRRIEGGDIRRDGALSWEIAPVDRVTEEEMDYVRRSIASTEEST